MAAGNPRFLEFLPQGMDKFLHIRLVRFKDMIALLVGLGPVFQVDAPVVLLPEPFYPL